MDWVQIHTLFMTILTFFLLLAEKKPPEERVLLAALVILLTLPIVGRIFTWW